jgi:hypothetical protein
VCVVRVCRCLGVRVCVCVYVFVFVCMCKGACSEEDAEGEEGECERAQG